jgi:hypothetical protein
MSFRLFAFVFAVWAFAVAGAAADPVFPTGLRIGLEPPPGMSVSRRFPGFEDAGNKAAITLVELPLPAYGSVEKSMFEFTPPGMTIEKREMLPFTDGVGILLVGKAAIDGVMMHHWFLLARSFGGANADVTALVTFTEPEAALAVYSDTAVRAALASVTFRPPPLAEQLATLPFKLGDLAGFHVMQALPAGGVIITDGPDNDIGRQPYMIVSVGTGAPVAPDDRARFARDMLSGAPLRELSVTSIEPMRLNGLSAIEVRATAKNLRGEPVKLVQWVRFGAGGYMRIIGVVTPDNWDQLFNRFRAVRDGIALR